MVSNLATFSIVPFSIVWEMHQNSVEMQNLEGRKLLFLWGYWCMNFKTSGFLPGNIQHRSIFYCLRNASEFCGNAKPLKRESICFHDKPDAWISKQVVSNQATFSIVPFSIVCEMHQNSVEMQILKGRKHLFLWGTWCMNLKKTSGFLSGNIQHRSIFYCLWNASEFCGNAKPWREKAFVSVRILMHEFQNKWFLTRQHLALFHFLLFVKCIRILWKCKTFKERKHLIPWQTWCMNFKTSGF